MNKYAKIPLNKLNLILLIRISNFFNMFYAAELLSRKNKNEISIVYYLSTTGSMKKINKHEILSLNFEKVLDNIRAPAIPFALRLYSYLIKGIVRLWNIKAEFYLTKARAIFLEKRIRKTRTIDKPYEQNVNLRVLDFVIGDSYLEQAYDNEANFDLKNKENEFLQDFLDNSNYNNDAITSSILEIESLENRRVGSSSIENSFQNSFGNLELFNASLNDKQLKTKQLKPHKKSLVDRITVLNSDDIYGSTDKILEPLSKKLKLTCSSAYFKDSVLHEFEKFCKSSHKRHDYDNIQLSFSLEDARVSSSISQDRAFESTVQFDISHLDSKEMCLAQKFYNLLVKASLNEVKVEQKESFGIIYVYEKNMVVVFE